MTPTAPTLRPSDRDSIVRWRQALAKGSFSWSDAQRTAFLAVLNENPELLLQGASPRSQRSFGHTLGEQGEDAWVMLALERCPAAAPLLVDGALRARRMDLTWQLLRTTTAPAAWAVLSDESQARRWARNLAYPAENARFQAWLEHGYPSLRQAMRRPRGRDHLLSQAIALQNAPLFETLIRLNLPLDGSSAGPDHPGSTVAHDLAYANWAEGVALLVHHRPDVDLNARNVAGHTALLLAARYERWAAAQALADAGADAHATTNDGKQALWFATTQGMKAGHAEATALALTLLLAGANPDRPEGKTTKASSVSDWMRANRPAAWTTLLVRRDTVALQQAVRDALPAPVGPTPAPMARPRSRL